ncbi:MAG: FtsX-like permease family protein [Myxococcales bacterium]
MSLGRDILLIGVRNVARNLRRSLITGGMVALGVASIVFFRAYVLGLQDGMIRLVVEQSDGVLQVERQGYSAAQDLAPLDLDLPLGEGLEQAVATVPGVSAVSPRLRFSALLLKGEDASTIVGGLGVVPEGEKKVCPSSAQAGRGWEDELGVRYGLAGPGLEGAGEASILVGCELAKGLKVGVGETVTLLAQTQKGSTDAVDAKVVGTFRMGDAELNKRLVLVPLGLAQRLLHMPGRATALVVAAERSQVQSLAAALRGRLAGLAPALDVRTWEQLAPYYRDVIRLQDDLMAIVMALFFVLMLAGVVNTMTMAAFERQREIGTLMSLGFRRKAILALFLTESFALGLAATTAGAAAGTLVVAVTRVTGIAFRIPGIGLFTNHPRLDWRYGAAAVGVALLAALLAGLFPAWKASRLQPVEAFSSP